MDLSNTLQLDAQTRNPSLYTQGNPDLFTLDKVDFTKDWDYQLPTIYSTKTVDLKNQQIRDIATFNTKFKQSHGDFFTHVDFNNVLIAGGSVIGTLLQQSWEGDIDIFLYGLRGDQALQKVVSLMNQIYKSYQEALMHEHEEDKTLSTEIEVETIRNKYAITMIFSGSSTQSGKIHPMNTRRKKTHRGNIKIQIILRLYRSVSEILHGFDMGSVAVGYDGTNVYFTSLGKFSYEYLVNIVDPTRRSTTYEKRLMKYYNRGFHIVLPQLDITKLKQDNLKYHIPEVAALPYFTFSYTKIQGNKITLDRLLEWGVSKEKYNAEYEHDSDYQAEDLDEYKIFYLNLSNLVRQGDNYYFYNTRPNFDVLTSPPYISVSRIIDYYDDLAKRIYHKGKFDIAIFKSYFSVDMLPHILTDIFLTDKGQSRLDDLIQLQKDEIIARLASLTPQHYGLKFITENPGSQLTGSFNPIVSDVRDWYGEYLRV